MAGYVCVIMCLIVTEITKNTLKFCSYMNFQTVEFNFYSQVRQFSHLKWFHAQVFSSVRHVASPV